MDSNFGVSARFRTARTRLAAGISVLGLVAVSTGLVMITAPTALAAVGDAVCHVTGADKNPYVFQSPDGSSTDPSQAHAAHIETWKKGTWWNGSWHAAGTTRSDIVGGPASESYCNASGEAAREVTPGVDFENPSCANGNLGSWTSRQLDGVTYSAATGTGGPETSVTVTATLADGYVLARNAQGSFPWTFGPAEADCGGTGGGDDDPTPVTPLEPSWIEATCDTDPSVDYTEVTGVEYATTGSVSPGGTATVTATVVNDDEYVLAPGARASWNHTFLAKPAGADCDGTTGGGTPGGNPGGNPGGGTDSPTNVTPLEPSWTEPTCSTPAAVAYRSVDGVAYRTEGDVAPGNRVVVRAEALEDHSFADGTVTWWAHTFVTPEDCGGGDPDGGGDDEGEPDEGVKPSPTVKGVEKLRPQTGAGGDTPQVLGTQAAVPTAVAAGLTDLTGAHGSPSAISSPQLAQALVAGGLLLLVVGGGLGLGRRTNGAHEF